MSFYLRLWDFDLNAATGVVVPVVQQQQEQRKLIVVIVLMVLWKVMKQQ